MKVQGPEFRKQILNNGLQHLKQKTNTISNEIKEYRDKLKSFEEMIKIDEEIRELKI